MIAWTFPGQGSQFVGMGAKLEAQAARDAWVTAHEVLGWDLRSACVAGPEEVLGQTEIAQPAILVASVAAARSLESSGLLPDLVAGHSVGEFAALVAARSLALEDALFAVKIRAEAMARAGRAEHGGMAAVIGLPADILEEVCRRVPGIVGIANVNGPDQVVLSGEYGALLAAGEAARDAGARRVVPLAVSVAAHSPLMATAAEHLRRALDAVTLLAPIIPFASSVAGRFLEDPAEIRASLVRALTGPMSWPACVRALQQEGADLFVEVGPGRVLSGLTRRIIPDARVVSVGDDASAVEFARSLASGAVL